MNCPKCNSPMSFAFALKVKNPRKFQCPTCGGILRTKNTAVLLIFSALIGVSITGFTIAMEKLGVWQQQFSPIFLLFSMPIAGLLWSLFLWRANKIKLTGLDA